jgi:hypothetical protein
MPSTERLFSKGVIIRGLNPVFLKPLAKLKSFHVDPKDGAKGCGKRKPTLKLLSLSFPMMNPFS